MQKFNGTEWDTIAYCENEYDDQDRPVKEEIVFILPSIDFIVAGVKHSTTYNEVNQPIVFVTERYLVNNQQWVKDTKEIYKYNTEGLKYLVEKYNADEDGVFSISSIDSITYNENNQLDTIFSNFILAENSGIERFSYQTVYVYEGSNLIKQTKSVLFEDVIYPREKTEYQYTITNDLLVESSSVFSEEKWLKSNKTEYFYDNTIKKESINFNSEDNNWIKTSKNIFTYDEGNRVIELLSKQWNKSKEEWELTNQSIRNVFQHKKPLNVFENDFQTYSTVFPNPTSHFLTINSTLNNTIKEMCIIDGTGKTIKQLDVFIKKIDVSDLSNGVYILSVKSRERTQMIRFIKR